MKPDAPLLVLCYGNPGRLDDGLGPAFGAALERRPVAGVTVEIDYQLTVEDAALAAQHDVVLFADAAVRGVAPFFLQPVRPRPALGISSHGADPEAILALAEVLSGTAPEGFALGIRGYRFDAFGEGLSAQARSNLDATLQSMRPAIAQRRLAAVATASAGAGNGAATVATEEEDARR